MWKRADQFLGACEDAVCTRDRELLGSLVMQAYSEGALPEVIREGIIGGLDRARGGFMTNRVSLPEFLLTLDTVNYGLEKIKDLDDPGRDEGGIPLVIGVVQGDPHDLGKNIIASVYRAYGFRVIDLGKGVTVEKFVDAVRTHGARIIALSAMMSTTTPAMGEVIGAVRSRGDRVAVMAGGAFIDAAMAARFGADGYAESAVTVIEKTREAYGRVFGENA
ncbi:MAG TPA: cobalamin-dependent protein [Deltaproteobacteria bacterium]|nr:cobalamin-dependent protein [Deltaproteobacteria bacterium]HPR55841.1 cobalamin-dependent protein [Deltaproteobacteria bacterium]HXK47690.1 cobalamin-dependent protein [Deltaproteobacteria bacterium]